MAKGHLIQTFSLLRGWVFLVVIFFSFLQSLVPRALQNCSQHCMHETPTSASAHPVSVLAGNVLHEIHLHGEVRGLLGPLPAEAGGRGEESTLQNPFHLLLAALDTGSAGSREATGAGGGARAAERLGFRAGLHGARRRCRAGKTRAAQVGAAASQGETIRLRPGR